MRIIADAAGSIGMVGGQAIDLQAAGQAPGHAVTLDAGELRAMHARKTGALITASAESGAVMAGGDEVLVTAVRHYAAQIGLAFQIIDDVLDVEGDAATLGKSAGKDAASAKPSYPAFYGVERSRSDGRRVRPGGAAALETAGLNRGWLSAIASGCSTGNTRLERLEREGQTPGSICSSSTGARRRRARRACADPGGPGHGGRSGAVSGHRSVSHRRGLAHHARPSLRRAWRRQAGACLDVFAISVSGRHALDVGASTERLHRRPASRGAASVVALDVGHVSSIGACAPTRASSCGKASTRGSSVTAMPRAVDLVTIDVAFISLRQIFLFAAAGAPARGRRRGARQTSVRGRPR